MVHVNRQFAPVRQSGNHFKAVPGELPKPVGLVLLSWFGELIDMAADVFDLDRRRGENTDVDLAVVPAVDYQCLVVVGAEVPLVEDSQCDHRLNLLEDD
jgi:hypothetical protein